MRTFAAAGLKVLVGDDNMINRMVAVGLLEDYGFELTEAASGPEAIELSRETKFDLIFMDHMMPEMDGIETTGVIRTECGENGRDVVIIALTADAGEDVREKFLKNGFQDYITKPLDRGALDRLLDQWIPDSRKQKCQEDAGEPEAGDFDSIRIDGIDTAEARKHHSGGLKDYQGLLKLYSMDGKRKLLLLRELLEKKDYHTYEIEVHGLKSASANVGAMELSAQARDHEAAAGRGDEAYIVEHAQKLLSDYETLVQEIGRYLEECEDVPEGDSADRESLAGGALLQKVGEALEVLENFRRGECVKQVGSMLEYRLDSQVKDRLKEIQEQLGMYEDDAAEELLRQLLEWLKKEEQ